ncbi:hypothetical protein AFM11_07315 [Mycolicibacterium wolinskyi]|uniref:N-acetyltransferase domain-containing protein n=1 Tax=Mycolicibacterium wolinskyi TaxID=59750 RepID=A0A132PT37_9MYCO|nr:GNAT family N-acetyltransferase [Mycolicibacterium wolinskyi]KWX25212.1 hypothetical protein AFM11_07315 [Mycolicibacterium wolinskyi]
MPDDAVLRTATLADVAAIERVIDEAFSRYTARIGREPAPMVADYRTEVANQHVTVLIEDADIIGVLVAEDRNDHMLIETVALAAAAQGRGYGRRLLEHAECRARHLGYAQVRLYTNAAMTENLTLYPHLGYLEVDRAIRDGFSRVYFTKDLD